MTFKLCDAACRFLKVLLVDTRIEVILCAWQMRVCTYSAYVGVADKQVVDNACTKCRSTVRQQALWSSLFLLNLRKRNVKEHGQCPTITATVKGPRILDAPGLSVLFASVGYAERIQWGLHDGAGHC